MEVVNTPGQELALTNCAFVSAADVARFPNSLALVGDALVLTLRAHDVIASGRIALNGIQRRQAKVSAGDSVTVSSFDPPDDFKLALLTLELAYVRAKDNQNELDAVLLAQQLRKRFLGQVMTTGQKVAFGLYGTNYVFTVNQALLEGQESSTPLDRGFLSSDTYIIFEAAPNSGIKIVNGPEVLSKFVGETEKNVRDLFADAENEQRTRGDQSDLHVIIFDEIDAICKLRVWMTTSAKVKRSRWQCQRGWTGISGLLGALSRHLF